MMRSPFRIGLLFLLMALAPALAQEPAAAVETEATPQPDKDPRGWVAAQLESAKKRESSLNEKTLQEELKKNGLPETLAPDFIATAHEVVRNYQASADVLATLSNNQRLLDDLQKQTEPLPAPKTDNEVDSLRDKIESTRLQLQTLETQVRIDDASLTRARTALEDMQQQYRRAVEDFDGATGDDKNRFSWLMQLAELRQQAASAAVFLASQRITMDEVDQKTKTLTLARLARALKESNLDTVFNVQRAQNNLSRITQARDAMRPQIDELRKAATALNNTVSKISEDLEAARKASRTTEVAALSARLTVASEAANLANELVSTQEAWFTGLSKNEEAWKSVLEATEKPILENYDRVRQLAEQRVAGMDPWQDQLPRNLQDMQRRLEEATNQPLSKDSGLRKLEETRLDLLRKREAQLRDASIQIANSSRNAQQMLSDSKDRMATQAISARAALVGDKVAGGLKGLWNQNLFTTKDEVRNDEGKVISSVQRGVTLGKLIIAITWLLVALMVSKIVSKTVSGRLGKRFSIDSSRIPGLEKALFFPLAALLVLTTLNWLRIPLTTFAFLGGALAIGVGFGVQTLVNNFISGLILLSERRIKVGDTIEVDNHTGAVTNLGTRCSRILKGNGAEVLVPNSYLLEKNVVNWTLSNNRHSFDFAVSLSYGTPIEKALAVLRQAVTEESKVLKEPAPVVSFDEFGANALIFRISYWLDLRGSDNRIIGTNIRMRIDRLCRTNDITIASPGQDMRLRTLEPLTIRIEEPPERH